MDLYDRLTRLAASEERKPDDSLPDPSEVAFSASETEWMYELWTFWRALGRPPNVSTLMKEIVANGGVVTGLLQLESMYAKVKQQLENQNPKK